MPALDRDGVQIAYDVIPGPAEATPLLLTHGYGASRAMWRPNLAALAATRTVVTWDMRGHGQSDSPQDPRLYSHEHTVDDMVAVLEACRIPVAAVGGLSLGGFMSLDFHRIHPGPVSKSSRQRTRSGWVRWKSSDMKPPRLRPPTAAAEMRQASSTATMSSTVCSCE